MAMVIMPLGVFAGVTGELSGKIVNEETGEPLPGVAVSVFGTVMGALTNDDGEYIILNVPVGTYNIQASLIGFAQVEVTNVAVSAELTSYTDFALSKKALELGRTITVRAERPLVLKDKTTTVNIVTSEELQALPIRTFGDAVSLQNSVVRMKLNVDVRQRNLRRTSSSTNSELNLRGGRPQEVAYYIDGFSQQDPLTGISTTNLNKNAIREVTVKSGVFDAEYGHVASGIVNVVTQSGSEKYHGTLELLTDNLVSESYDHNYYNGDIGGPIPGLENAFFFVSAERRFLRDRTPSIKTKEVYEEFGVDETLGLEDSHRFPGNALSGWSGQAKLDFQLTPEIKLALTGNASIDWWQQYRHGYLFNYKHAPKIRDKNWGVNAKVTHNFGENAYYNLSGSYFYTERYMGDGEVFMSLNNYTRLVSNPEWDDNDLFREWTDSSHHASEVDPSIAPDSPEDTVVYIPSYYQQYHHRESAYIGFKGDINKQYGAHHTLKAGFDLQLHNIRRINVNPATNLGGFNYTRWDYYGYDSLGNRYDGDEYTQKTKTPNNLGVFLQDRFEWRGLIIRGGLRYDRFDYNTLRIKDLDSPLNPGDDPNDLDTLDRGDLDDSKVFQRLSPRLGVGFPISERTQLHVNYGIFYQRPNLTLLYLNYKFFEARTDAGSYFAFSSPNLEPEQITQYEAGITHQLGMNTAFGITAYYKDVQDQAQIFHKPASPTAYDFYSNTDYGTVKGIDFNLTMRRTRNIRLNLNYTLAWATGTGSYAGTQYNVAWKEPDNPPKVTNPLDYDQRHNIVGVIDVRTGKGEGPLLGDVYPLENLSVNAIVQLASGTPYTPTNKYDAAREGIAVWQTPTGSVNSANKPWTSNIDVKIERKFEIDKYVITPYIWVQNLLETENIFLVYEGTGRPDKTGWLETDPGIEWASTNDDSTYRLKESNPKNYGKPRIFYFGIRMSF
jgi:outer membrane receptor protein involved in Fe transport